MSLFPPFLGEYLPWLAQNIWIPDYRDLEKQQSWKWGCNDENLAEFKNSSLFWYSFRIKSVYQLEDIWSVNEKVSWHNIFSTLFLLPQNAYNFLRETQNWRNNPKSVSPQVSVTYPIQVNLCHLWQLWIISTFPAGGKKN